MKRSLSAAGFMLFIVLFLTIFSLSTSVIADSSVPGTLVGIKSVSVSSAYYKGKTLMLPAKEAAAAIGYYIYRNDTDNNYMIYDVYGRYATVYPAYNAYASNEYLYKVLSTAPVIADGVLYVPIDLFTTLLKFDVANDGGTVTFTDNTTYNIVKLTNPRLFRTTLKYQDNDSSRLLVIGLYGYSYLYPENTMLAYRKAIEIGVDELKVDVRLSKDGVPVLIHDSSVERTAPDATGNVSDMTLAELKKLDIGTWMNPWYKGETIPTLEELFEYIKPYPSLMINIEIRSKDKATVDAAYAVIEKYNMTDKVLLTCNDGDIIDYAYTQYHMLTQGYSPGNMKNFVEGPDGTLSKMQYILFDDSLVDGLIITPYYNDGITPYTFDPDTIDSVKSHLESGSCGLVCSDPTAAIVWLRTCLMR